jgi:HAD superfamily, subfamily IIIB (Acid phosphatase)
MSSWSTHRLRCGRTAAVLALVVPGFLLAISPLNASIPSHGHDDKNGADTVPNIANVRDEIMEYYGDSGNHVASADSAYAHDVRLVEANVTGWLRTRASTPQSAVVFDVDDTLLSSYAYGATHEFSGYTLTGPASGPLAECVRAKCLWAVFGMSALVSAARAMGYSLFYVTGRPRPYQSVTLQNLAEQGIPAPRQLFTKPTTAPFPSYLPCNASCTTIDYKSRTRAHIERFGYQIVANIGDQASDLAGGHAERTFRVPNPMYITP